MNHPLSIGGLKTFLNGKKSQIGAFSLLELLVVITIIMVLTGLLMSAFHRVRKEQNIATTRGIIHTLQIGIEKYNNEYGHWPCTQASDNSGYRTPPSGILNNIYIIRGDTYRTNLYAMLLGDDRFLDGSKGGNPKQIHFMEINSRFLDKDELVDAWHHPFTIAFDDNSDRSVKIYNNNTPVNADMAIYSNGPDGLVNTAGETDAYHPSAPENADNITNW